MNKREAIQAMLDGKKIYNTSWRSSESLSFNGTLFTDEKNNRHDINNTDGEIDSWEIYKEPKKMVKFYRYQTEKVITHSWYSDCGLSYYPESKHVNQNLAHNNNTWTKIQGAFTELEI